MAGKLGRQGDINAVCPGPLLFLKDLNSGVKFLVDSGATVSILPGPASPVSAALSLTTANVTRIATGVERHVNLSFQTSGSSSNSFFCLCVDSASACVRHLPSTTVYPCEESFSLGSAAAVLPAGI